MEGEVQETFQEAWLEAILKKFARERRVARVTGVTAESVVKKGDNYVSDMTRLNMEVRLENGKTARRSIVVKSALEGERSAKITKEWKFFKTETKVYRDIIPYMEDILFEVGDRSDMLWGQCMDYIPYNRIVFEDLKELGYQMADKYKGLDLAHSILAMKGLAKWHALSLALMDRGIIDKDEFGDHFFLTDPNAVQFFHDMSLNSLAEAIETTWGKEYSHIVEKVIGLVCRSTTERMLSNMKRKDDDFTVLLHGDCWTNNMLYKYVTESDVPASLKFVDFQMSLTGSPGLDLQYFMSTSLSCEMRRERTEDLLRVYQEGLVSWMRRFSCSQEPPTLEDVLAWYKSKAFFGLMVTLTALPLMFAKPEDAITFEDIREGYEENSEKGKNIANFLGKAYTERAKYALEEALRAGLI